MSDLENQTPNLLEGKTGESKVEDGKKQDDQDSQGQGGSDDSQPQDLDDLIKPQDESDPLANIRSKFNGEDGKLDVDKVLKSYQELESSYRNGKRVDPKELEALQAVSKKFESIRHLYQNSDKFAAVADEEFKRLSNPGQATAAQPATAQDQYAKLINEGKTREAIDLAVESHPLVQQMRQQQEQSAYDERKRVVQVEMSTFMANHPKLFNTRGEAVDPDWLHEWQEISLDTGVSLEQAHVLALNKLGRLGNKTNKTKEAAMQSSTSGGRPVSRHSEEGETENDRLDASLTRSMGGNIYD